MKYVEQLFCLVVLALLTNCSDSDSEKTVIDCSASDVSVAVVESTKPGCTTTGSMSVSGSGGTAPYTFSINGSNFQSETSFSDLSAGNYSIEVMDADGCTSQTTFNLEGEGNSVTILVESTDSDCAGATGSITVTASGGDGSYQYSVDGGTQQESNIFDNVAPGTYEISVVDGSGCEASQAVQVATGISLSGDIMPLLQAQCTFSGCHNGDNGASRDWTQKSNVIAMANNIKTRTQNGSMPRNPGVLTQDELDIIACWVDDGAKDN